MNRPTIEINGQIIEMKNLKARIWREVMKFETERKDIATVDYVDKQCEIIAMAFGVTADEVLDNLEIGEVTPKYFEVFNAIVAMLTEKLGKKNVETEVATQA